MKPKLLLLALVLALQTTWILGTTYRQERALRGARVVCLETRPVDPRDLIRGDYLILNYKISDLDWSLFSPPLAAAPSPGQTIYVALEPRGEFYEAVRASMQPIASAAGQIVLKGKAQNRPGNANLRTVHVLYGLERYFVREGTGNPRGKLTVHAAVAPSGQGTLKAVFLDGKPYGEAMKAQEK